MIEYSYITLDNGEKNVIVDVAYYDNKQFVLLLKILENGNISNDFTIYMYDDKSNMLTEINDDEFELLKELFESKLDNQRLNLRNINVNLNKLVKLRVTGINNYDYILEDELGNKVIKNIELYIDKKLEIGNYIYLSQNIIKEKNIFQYGKILDNNINEDDLLIIECDNNNRIYLQRYYG